MTQVRLYFDADSMQRAVLTGLRARGIDVTTALESGMTDRLDDEQLEFARSQGRVLFSFNASHFCRIHAVAGRRKIARGDRAGPSTTVLGWRARAAFTQTDRCRAR